MVQGYLKSSTGCFHFLVKASLNASNWLFQCSLEVHQQIAELKSYHLPH